MTQHTLSRRFVLRTLFGAGALGLRSLATGIPTWILANPRRAAAQAASQCVATKPQFLIFSTSANGDSIGNNAPGTYLSNNSTTHPLQTSMAATPLTLAGQSYVAAAPWAALPQQMLDQTVFFHHSTMTGVHANEPIVMALNNGTLNKDPLPSVLAAQLAPCLNTIQWQPMVLGADGSAEGVVAGGAMQPILYPTALASVFGSTPSPLTNLQKIRDDSLNALNAIFRAQGNKAQQSFIDQYVLSQQQVRSISQDLVSQLSALTDNSIRSQLAAALILFRMRIAPVATVHMSFGGDNHSDPDLAAETAQTVDSLAALREFYGSLQTVNMQDRVTFAVLNVFGRPFTTSQGRTHNMNHNMMLISGSNIVGGVIGGIVPYQDDYAASPFDSQTGLADPGGDINIPLSLGSAGKTLAAAVGLSSSIINTNILTGKIVPAALRNV